MGFFDDVLDGIFDFIEDIFEDDDDDDDDYEEQRAREVRKQQLQHKQQVKKQRLARCKQQTVQWIRVQGIKHKFIHRIESAQSMKELKQVLFCLRLLACPRARHDFVCYYQYIRYILLCGAV